MILLPIRIIADRGEAASLLLNEYFVSAHYYRVFEVIAGHYFFGVYKGERYYIPDAFVGRENAVLSE